MGHLYQKPAILLPVLRKPALVFLLSLALRVYLRQAHYPQKKWPESERLLLFSGFLSRKIPKP